MLNKFLFLITQFRMKRKGDEKDQIKKSSV